MDTSRAWKDVSKELGELVGNPEIDDELKQPFLYEAEVCASKQLPYATIIMLGLCAEAYAKLLAKKLEEIDKTLIPHFGERAYKHRSDFLRELQKIRDSGGADGLYFMEIVNILNEMQLLTTDGEQTNPFHKLNFTELARIRNDYGHPNWKEIKESLLLQYIDKLKKVIVHKVDSVRFTSASKLVEFIIKNAQTSPSSFIRLIPFHEFSIVAESIFQSLSATDSGDFAERLQNFWRHLKKSARLDEEGKIEAYFIGRLEQSIRGEIEKKPNDLIYLIDWNGSEDFCNKCAESLLDWLESELNATPRLQALANLSALPEVVEHLVQYAPESYLDRANNVMTAIQQRIQENAV